MTSNHCYLYHPILYYSHEMNPPDPSRWGCLCVRAECECTQTHTPVWVWGCLKWRSFPSLNCLLSFMADTHVQRRPHTQARQIAPPPTSTHTYPLLKRHIGWIYCVLSCCLLWMGKAAYLQWIVNPAERSAVRDLWIANMLYFAPLIPLYLPPITFTERSAKRAGNQRE